MRILLGDTRSADGVARLPKVPPAAVGVLIDRRSIAEMC
jgi:hypothetical protein